MNFPSWTHKSQSRWVSGAIRKKAPNWDFRDPGFSLFEARDSGFESKIRGEFEVLKVCLGSGMRKITLGITGLHEIFGRDYGLEPYWGSDLRSAEVTRAERESEN